MSHGPHSGEGSLAEPQMHQIELPCPPAEALRHLATTAEDWGAEWLPAGPGGRLRMPATAGVRHGWVGGQVDVARSGSGAKLTYAVDESHFAIQRAKLMFLLLGGFGGVVTMVAPAMPKLWPLVPPSLVMALGAWLFVVARLRNSGPEELLQELEDRCEER